MGWVRDLECSQISLTVIGVGRSWLLYFVTSLEVLALLIVKLKHPDTKKEFVYIYLDYNTNTYLF